jgi:hypothetical protein
MDGQPLAWGRLVRDLDRLQFRPCNRGRDQKEERSRGRSKPPADRIAIATPVYNDTSPPEEGGASLATKITPRRAASFAP